jgi:serine/threonine protein kinase
LTTDAARRVEISSLRQGAVLGSGGQGQVVTVDNHLIDGKWPAALKTYNNSVSINLHALEKVVAFPDQLHRNDRDWLMGVSSWPRAIATRNGIGQGFLMRVVPDVYHFDYMTVTKGSTAKLSTVEYLLNPDSYVSAAGISITERDRLNLLGTLAETMSRLHALGIVVGDLSPKNLLLNLNSYSSCFIIDCDAISLRGESALEQVDTPEWEVPPGEKKGTEASDSYKFGLLAIRLFGRDQSSRDTSALSALSSEMGRLAELSQDLNTLRRPSPGSWVSAIQSAASSASSTSATQTSLRQPNAGYQQYNVYYSPRQQHGSAVVQPPVVQPPPKRRSGTKALARSVLGLLVVVLAIIGVDVSHSNTKNLGSSPEANSTGSPITDSGSSAADIPSSQPVPSDQPAQVGIVSISNSLSGNPPATAVAQMFNTYFTGINNRDYTQALSVFDPNGVINPNDSNQVQHFTDGVSTSSDSAVTLVNVDPADGSTVQSAEVQFTSHQQAGYGPQDDPSATCNNWDVTYALTQDSSDNYLIYNVSKESNSGC